MSLPSTEVLKNRILGTLYGLTVSDALGAPYEFHRRGTYKTTGEMEYCDNFNLVAGSWTDDSTMMLCLAASLVEKKTLDWKDCAQKFVKWYREGYMSVNGTCFDIGNATRSALHHYTIAFEDNKTLPAEPSANPTRNLSGNGSIMRLAPVPVLYHAHRNLDELYSIIARSSKITHSSSLCLDACNLLATYIIGFLHAREGATPEEKKAEILNPKFGLTNESGQIVAVPLQTEEIAELHQNASYKTKQASDIKTSGFVLHTFEAALWALWNAESYEQGILMILPLGDDVDTVGAVYGQLAGACFGFDEIPSRWLNKLQKKKEILDPVLLPLLELSLAASV